MDHGLLNSKYIGGGGCNVKLTKNVIFSVHQVKTILKVPNTVLQAFYFFTIYVNTSDINFFHIKITKKQVKFILVMKTMKT